MMDADGRLPGTASPDGEDQIVCHVDADCFYAACERLREPALEGEPVVVGMGYAPEEPGGVVATASYEAREYGVESAQPIEEALESLPRAETSDAETVGHYRPVDIPFYETVAADIRDILEAVAGVLRVVSIDEAYLDVTDRTTWPDAPAFARNLRIRIAEEVGVPVSIGVAPSMSAAKVASDHDKPEGCTVVEPGQVASFLAPLPLERLHGVGPVTARELHGMGLETVGDVAATDRGELTERFGERGRELAERAAGEDDRPVTPRGLPKSFSRESAFSGSVPVERSVYEKLETLAASVAERVEREGALFRTIGVKVVQPPYDVNTRERSLPGPVDDTTLIEPTAAELLSEFDGEAIRKLGVRVSKLSFVDADQADLETWEETDQGADAGPLRGQSSLDAFGTDS